MTHPGSREQTIADYLAVVRRYKWVIIVAMVVVPGRRIRDVGARAEDLPRDVRRPPQQPGGRGDALRNSDAEHRHGSVPVCADAGTPRRVAGGPRPRARDRRSRADRRWGSDVSADPDTDILTFGGELRRAGNRGAARDRVRTGVQDVQAADRHRRADPGAPRDPRAGSSNSAEQARATAIRTGSSSGRSRTCSRSRAVLIPPTVIRERRQCGADRPDAEAQRRFSAPCSGSCSESAPPLR